MTEKFVDYAGWISRRLINLVDGNNDRHVTGLGMLNSFDGLRHNSVIGSNHENHDIGCGSTAGTHCGKCGMTRSIEEGDGFTLVGLYVVSTDVLGNTAGFA